MENLNLYSFGNRFIVEKSAKYVNRKYNKIFVAWLEFYWQIPFVYKASVYCKIQETNANISSWLKTDRKYLEIEYVSSSFSALFLSYKNIELFITLIQSERNVMELLNDFILSLLKCEAILSFQF